MQVYFAFNAKMKLYNSIKKIQLFYKSDFALTLPILFVMPRQLIADRRMIFVEYKWHLIESDQLFIWCNQSSFKHNNWAPSCTLGSQKITPAQNMLFCDFLLLLLF